ncbi:MULTISPECIES: ferredoxin reductase family protein [unclassified Curtobacterium]|uniref:ferredoxin reductase family protein n=1 Tax=unclassified Curtobacterium TaxID=257496 RepID=UPI00226B0306|nr:MULTISPECIES: ferredoxin reductase family protein [unclassified Curtobacterium]
MTSGRVATVADPLHQPSSTKPRGSAVSAATALVLVGLGAVGVALLAIAGSPSPLMVDLPLVAHVAGLLGGYAVTVMILLMARVPALERGVGADRMARWHGRVGRTTLILILIHAVAATLAWAGAQGIPLLTASTQVLAMPGLSAATVATVLFIVVGLLSARAARRRVRYETWHTIHLLTYVAIGLSFSHELAGPDLAGRRLVQVAWSVVFTMSFALLLRYRVIAPLLQASRHHLRVLRVERAGPGTVNVIVGGDDLLDLDAEPGQFFRWRFLTTRTWRTAHPFSLSAPATHGTLRLTVKAVGDGTQIIQSLRPGTRVLAEGPYGAMTQRRRTRNGLLLIAGGVGITPMRTLFETMAYAGGPLTLLYRAPTMEDILFRRELELIAETRRAHLVYLIGSSKEPWNAMTPENLMRLVPGLQHRDVYICAGPALSRVAVTALRQAGLPRRNVHREDFSF